MRYSRLGYWGLQTLAAVLMLIAAAFVMWVLPPRMVLLKAGILTISLIATFALGLFSYRKADEVILQTHKTAWFWGSLSGVLVAALIAIATLIGAIPVPILQRTLPNRPEVMFANGVIIVVLLEVAGFCVFWAYHNRPRWR